MGKRAFDGDWAVREYFGDTAMLISVTLPSEFWQYHVSQALQLFLERDWRQRPNATKALSIFSFYCRLFDLSVAPILSKPHRYPLYFHSTKVFEVPCNEPEIFLQLAKVYEENDIHQPAVALFREMIHRYITDQNWTFPIHYEPDDVWWKLAETLEAKHLYDEAISLYKTAIEISPDNVAFRKGLSDLYLRKGDHREALYQYDVATEKRPWDFWLWHYLCEACISINNVDGAIMVCQRRMGKYPASSSLILVLGNLYAAKSFFGDAVKVQRELIDGVLKEHRKNQHRKNQIPKNLNSGYSTEVLAHW
jgi:tetratricopeptide (TPR) repeat protein